MVSLKRKNRQGTFAGLFGNALEWYDFILYAYFAPLFASLFFPSQNEHISLLATFGVFASGFVARPLGGYFLGRCADLYGRRIALIASITIITIATILIAFLPTYHLIGYWAPIFLTLLRFIQGIAVGGELANSTTYLVEHSEGNKKGLLGSLILSTAFFGMLAGSAMTTVVSSFFYGSLLNHGWRFAYLCGGLFGCLAIFLRIKSSESPEFLTHQSKAPLPLRDLFTSYYKELILAFSFTCLLAVGNYILIAYTSTFLDRFMGFSLHEAALINFYSLLLLSILIPIFGIVSDKVNREIVLSIGIIGTLLASFPIFLLLSSGKYYYALGAELLLALVLAPINAIVPVIIVELFPVPIRVTGSSLAYNVSQAIFGGTTPLVLLLLIDYTNNNISPSFYLFFYAFAALLAIIFLRKQERGHVFE